MAKKKPQLEKMATRPKKPIPPLPTSNIQAVTQEQFNKVIFELAQLKLQQETGRPIMLPAELTVQEFNWLAGELEKRRSEMTVDLMPAPQMLPADDTKILDLNGN